MKTQELLNTPLFRVTVANFAAVLSGASASPDPSAWEHRLGTIKRLGLNVIVTADNWSSFPFKRTVVTIDRERLAVEDYLQEISALLATNWLELLSRQMSAGSEIILLRVDAPILALCLDTLFVNRATGDDVVQLMLKEEVNALMADDPVVRKVFANLEGEGGFKRIERIAARNLKRSGEAIEKRLDQRFADIKADLAERSCLIREAADARAALAILEMQVSFQKKP